MLSEDSESQFAAAGGTLDTWPVHFAVLHEKPGWLSTCFAPARVVLRVGPSHGHVVVAFAPLPGAASYACSLWLQRLLLSLFFLSLAVLCRFC